MLHVKDIMTQDFFVLDDDDFLSLIKKSGSSDFFVQQIMYKYL